MGRPTLSIKAALLKSRCVDPKPTGNILSPPSEDALRLATDCCSNTLDKMKQRRHMRRPLRNRPAILDLLQRSDPLLNALDGYPTRTQYLRHESETQCLLGSTWHQSLIILGDLAQDSQEPSTLMDRQQQSTGTAAGLGDT
ncbi:hypothetical protein GCM10010406_56250 [Streptomyces thermolineatus]|uniref:Uncharacterized protein n=1 Tax=Streptomyces thermolineatus TaxID=44033 RepID=A0ABP6ABI3_9ACTN